MVKHICKCCNFESVHKSNYDMHLLTKKHTNNMLINNTENNKIMN
jgi:hypothetical protein